jgi:hypothetical protein
LLLWCPLLFLFFCWFGWEKGGLNTGSTIFILSLQFSLVRFTFIFFVIWVVQS